MGGSTITQEEVDQVSAWIDADDLQGRLPKGTVQEIARHTKMDETRIYGVIKRLRNQSGYVPVSSRPSTAAELFSTIGDLERERRDHEQRIEVIDDQIQSYMPDAKPLVLDHLQLQNEYLTNLVNLSKIKSISPLELTDRQFELIKKVRESDIESIDIYVQKGFDQYAFSLLMPLTKVETIKSNKSPINPFHEGMLEVLLEVYDCRKNLKAFYKEGFFDVAVKSEVPYQEKADELESMMNEVQFLPEGIDPISVRLIGNASYRIF